MKINKLEAHDKLLDFKKQSEYISQGCKDCVNGAPDQFKAYNFYIFAHKRTIEMDEKIGIYQDDLNKSICNPLFYKRKYDRILDVPSARMIWEPRLTRPRAQSNSMLFKAYPGTDEIKVIWILPDKSLWSQYKKDNFFDSHIICESIYNYQNNKEKLEQCDDEDLSDSEISAIYQDIANCSKYDKQMKSLYDLN